MIIVTARDFRDNQAKHLDLADQGQEILITRKNNKAYKLTPIGPGDTLKNKAEFIAELKERIQLAEAGEVYGLRRKETLSQMLDRLADEV